MYRTGRTPEAQRSQRSPRISADLYGDTFPAAAVELIFWSSQFGVCMHFFDHKELHGILGKIAMIGAGSIGFTRKLMQRHLGCAGIGRHDVRLHGYLEHEPGDGGAACAGATSPPTSCRRTVDATHDRRQAIADADYVICTIRQGGLDAFQTDIDIPLKYGIDQCVGDTLCRGRHHVRPAHHPGAAGLLHDIREVAKPDALFLNYSNPMAMNTWACNQYGGVRTIGLCHGVQGGHWQIARCIEHWAQEGGLISPDEKLHRREVDIVAAGINHQTWYIKAAWRGMDMIPRLLELFEMHPTYPRTEKVRIDVLRRFGYYSTESNGHLSEYLPWYRKRAGRDQPVDRPVELDQWRDRRLPARLHRGPQLVRDRLPELAGGRTARRFAPRSAARNMARTSLKPRDGPHLSRPLQHRERGTSRICPTAV